MRRLLVAGALGAWLAGTTAQAAIPAEVAIDSGRIAGTAGASPDVRVFKGIPYAAAPTGANRWRPPQPVAPWQGVRDAKEYAPRCTQGRPGGPNAAAPPTSEDCLYLNVWTPAATPADRRPVMFWIYGGAYLGGAGSEPRYAGDGLAQKGAVVVTFNYRLGGLGFLAHPELSAESDRKISGNYALQDAVAALQWVQRNIAEFGGDPQNVTVFGESAGANMTSALIGAPAGKGLFHRAIVQSGAWMGLGMRRMQTLAEAERAGAKAAADAGSKSLAELRAQPAQEAYGLVRAAGLVVDGALLPEDLSLTFAAGRQNPVDVLVGSNRDEGTFFPRPGLTAEQLASDARAKYGDLADEFLALYPARDDASAEAAYLASFSDEAAWHMRKLAEVQAKRGNAAFLYYFTRVPPAAPNRPSRGATHVAEIPYMFDNLLPGPEWTDLDRRLAATMASYWASFARTGNPNGTGLPEWPAFGASVTGRALVLGDTVATQTAPIPSPEKLAFFEAAYRQLLERDANP